MSKVQSDFVIYVPRKLVRNEMELELRKGVLMAFCWIKRNGSIDGIYSTTLRFLMNDYGLHYDESKTKRLPKQASIILKGFDYLIENEYASLIKGSYNTLDSFFVIKIKNEKFDEQFIPLKMKYFDYVIGYKKRTDKMGLLYSLLFVLSCYSIRTTENSKERLVACSYSLEYISKLTGITKISLFNYLNVLSTEEGYFADTPLIKSKPYNKKIENRIIRFSNIFVENKANAHDVILYQRKIINEKFRTKTMNSELEIYNFDDLDNFEFY